MTRLSWLAGSVVLVAALGAGVGLTAGTQRLPLGDGKYTTAAPKKG